MVIFYLYEFVCLVSYVIFCMVSFIFLSFSFRGTLSQLFVEPLRELFFLGSFTVKSLSELLDGELYIILFLSVGWGYLICSLGINFLVRGILFSWEFYFLIFTWLFHCSFVFLILIYGLNVFLLMVKQFFYFYIPLKPAPVSFIFDFNFIQIVLLEVTFFKCIYLSLLIVSNLPFFFLIVSGTYELKYIYFALRLIFFLLIILIISLVLPPDIMLHSIFIFIICMLLEGIFLLCCLLISFCNQKW